MPAIPVRHPAKHASRQAGPADPGCIELASRADLGPLAELERVAFAGDRISPRSWGRLILSRSATVTVAREPHDQEAAGVLLGAAVSLRRTRGSLARLYSIAVAPAARGRGVASCLIADAVSRTRGGGATWLQLETRADNDAAQRLFIRHGFSLFGRKAGYYEDGADALRFRKSLTT